MKTYALQTRRVVLIAALCCLSIGRAMATVDQATLSLTGPSGVSLGSSFSIAVNLELPLSMPPSSISFFTTTVWYFPDNAPSDFLGHVPLTLDNITPGSLLNGTDYSISSNTSLDPRQLLPQSAVVFSGTSIGGGANGNLLNLQFTAALDGVGTTQPIKVEVDLYDMNFAQVPMEPQVTNVNILPPTIAVPEASTGILITGGLLLILLGRRKLVLVSRA